MLGARFGWGLCFDNGGSAACGTAPSPSEIVVQATTPRLASIGLPSIAVPPSSKSPGPGGDDGVNRLLAEFHDLLASQQRIEGHLASLLEGQAATSSTLSEVQSDIEQLHRCVFFKSSIQDEEETSSDWSGDDRRRGSGDKGVEGRTMAAPEQDRATSEGEKAGPAHGKTTSGVSLQHMLHNVFLTVGLVQEESAPRGCLSEFVGGNYYCGFYACVVLVECAFVCYSVDYEMARVGKQDDHSELLKVVQLIFIVLYSLELTLKLIVHRMHLICGHGSQWNIFDITLLAISVFDVAASHGGANPTFIKVLRFVRVVKVFRVLRLVNLFPQLSLICTSMLNSVATLAYSILLMTITLYIFAVLFVQGAVSFLEQVGEERIDAGVAEDVRSVFGSVGEAMLHLYMSCTNGEDWVHLYSTVSKMGVAYAGFYLFFNLFVQITVLNIITSMFVERVTKQAHKNSEDAKAKHWLKRRNKATDRWRYLSKRIDSNRNGTINANEFSECCKCPDWERYWASLGLEVKDVETFFNTLRSATESGEVDVDRFVNGCMKLSGSASSLDMQTLLFLVDDLKSKQKDLHEALQKMQDHQGLIAKQLTWDGGRRGADIQGFVSRALSRKSARNASKTAVAMDASPRIVKGD